MAFSRSLDLQLQNTISSADLLTTVTYSCWYTDKENPWVGPTLRKFCNASSTVEVGGAPKRAVATFFSSQDNWATYNKYIYIHKNQKSLGLLLCFGENNSLYCCTTYATYFEKGKKQTNEKKTIKTKNPQHQGLFCAVSFPTQRIVFLIFYSTKWEKYTLTKYTTKHQHCWYESLPIYEV